MSADRTAADSDTPTAISTTGVLVVGQAAAAAAVDVVVADDDDDDDCFCDVE